MEMISEIPAIDIFSVNLDTSKNHGILWGPMIQQRRKQYCVTVNQ